MNANQLSVTTIQNRDNDLNVHGIDHGFSFHSPTSIDSAGMVSIAFMIGYAIMTANMATPPWVERSERPIENRIRYARSVAFPAMLAIMTLLLSLLRNSRYVAKRLYAKNG